MSTSDSTHTDTTPTVVLVHGAFVDASSTQRPVSLDAFTTTVTGTPAWKTLPSWAIIATADQAIHPDAERDMAKRAESTITEIDASHAVPASQPADVAKIIVRAVKAIA